MPMVNEVFLIRKCDLDKITRNITDDGYYCSAQGIRTIISMDLYKKLDELEYFYFHVLFVKGEIPTVNVDKVKQWHYSLIENKDLLRYHETGEIVPLEIVNYEKEETTMFQNYIIKEVEFGELNVVAIKASLKEIAKNMDGVSIEKEGGDTYLVKDGTAVKLDSEEFQKQVETYVVGKTLAELRKNAAMYQLITKLGLIQKCTLTKSDSGLAGIFGE